MQIILKSPGQAVADFSVSGAIVSVSGYQVDVAARQLDTALLIEIRRDGEAVGEISSGAYLAQIEIPGRQWHEVESEQASPADGEEPAPMQAPPMERVALPLDTNAVSVTLWPAI